MSYTLDCGVSVSTIAEWEEALELLHAAVGRSSCSNGLGFGQLDMQWVFETLEEAKAAEVRLRSTPLAFDYLTILETISWGAAN